MGFNSGLKGLNISRREYAAFCDDFSQIIWKILRCFSVAILHPFSYFRFYFLFLKRPRRLTSSIPTHCKQRKSLRETHYLIQKYVDSMPLFICPHNQYVFHRKNWPMTLSCHFLLHGRSALRSIHIFSSTIQNYNQSLIRQYDLGCDLIQFHS